MTDESDSTREGGSGDEGIREGGSRDEGIREGGSREGGSGDGSGDGDIRAGGSGDGGSLGGSGDISAQDQQALTDLFASLTADAPPSEVSPLRIVKLGNAERNESIDRRIRRLKIVRNVAVAAAIATVVVLAVPKILGNSTSDSASAPAQNAPAAAASAAPAASIPVAAAGSVSDPNLSGEFAVQGSTEASSAAAASGAAAPAASAPAASAPAAPPSAAAAASSAASFAASSAGSGTASSAAAASSGAASSAAGESCDATSTRTEVAVRAALTANALALAGLSECSDRKQLAPEPTSSTAGTSENAVLVNVRKAPPSACGTTAPVTCHAVTGASGAYRTTSGELAVWVYGKGYEVYLQPVIGGPSIDRLISAGRAVIKALD